MKIERQRWTHTHKHSQKQAELCPQSHIHHQQRKTILIKLNSQEITKGSRFSGVIGEHTASSEMQPNFTPASDLGTHSAWLWHGKKKRFTGHRNTDVKWYMFVHTKNNRWNVQYKYWICMKINGRTADGQMDGWIGGWVHAHTRMQGRQAGRQTDKQTGRQVIIKQSFSVVHK